MRDNPVLRVVGKIIVPAIFLFALYVQFHGDYGPGGGFQAGVIFAAGIILYGIIFGVGTLRNVLPSSLTRLLLTIGVLLYSGVGIAGILSGGNYLDYNLLGESEVQGQIIGIFLVELGVGITVSSVMILIYYSFNKFEDNK